MSGSDHGERLATLEAGVAAVAHNTDSLRVVWGRIGDHETRISVMENQMREIRWAGRIIIALIASAVILQVLAMAGIVGGG